jgi:hypothetical protein
VRASRAWLRPGAEVPRGAHVCANLTLVFLPFPRTVCFVVQTKAPTKPPTKPPTKAPPKPPTKAPTKSPTDSPSASPSDLPTRSPTETPTAAPTQLPTGACPIGTTYWVYDPVTNKPTRRLLNNTITCLAHPYNLEVRPCRNNATVTLDRYVRIRLVDVARTLVFHQSGRQRSSPFFCLGLRRRRAVTPSLQVPRPSPTVCTTLGPRERRNGADSCSRNAVCVPPARRGRRAARRERNV